MISGSQFALHSVCLTSLNNAKHARFPSSVRFISRGTGLEIFIPFAKTTVRPFGRPFGPFVSRSLEYITSSPGATGAGVLVGCVAPLAGLGEADWPSAGGAPPDVST